MKHPDFPNAEIVTRHELRRWAAGGWRVVHSLSVREGEILSLRNGKDIRAAFLQMCTVYEGEKVEGLAEIGNALARLCRLKNTRLPHSVHGMLRLAESHLETAERLLSCMQAEPDPMPTERQTSFRKGGT